MSPDLIDEGVLQELAGRIADAVRPERIVLFGSFARGDATDDSDIDLFVEVPSGVETAQATTKAYAAIRPLRPRLGRSVDIVVKEHSFVARYGDLVGTVVRPVLREGRELYAAR